MVTCPLCFNNKEIKVIKGPDSRAYHSCEKCKLIFTESRFHPTKTQEKERYLTHQNGIQYKGYVEFLNQAIEPALPLLTKKMKGLDYGCGPVPTLSVLVHQQGFSCDDYDPFFFPQIPADKYDFIFATECFEHFFKPAKEISKITKLLTPGGILVVMTETWESAEAFQTWYYAKDVTHVVFYHSRTFRFIAEKYGFELLKSNNERVIILQKK